MQAGSLQERFCLLGPHMDLLENYKNPLAIELKFCRMMKLERISASFSQNRLFPMLLMWLFAKRFDLPAGHRGVEPGV
jgi:hypothetical protein